MSKVQNDLLWTEQSAGPLIFELRRLLFRAEECRDHICLSRKDERGPGSPLLSCNCKYASETAVWNYIITTVIPNRHYNETLSNVNLLVIAHYFRIKTAAYAYQLSEQFFDQNSIHHSVSLIYPYWILLSDWIWIYRSTIFFAFLSSDFSRIVSEWLSFGFHNFIWKSH